MQKLSTDFGAECPFGQAVNRLKEHHGVELAESMVRRIVQRCAQRAKHSMIPTVSFEDAVDKRKTRKTKWEEIRVAAAQKPGQVTWHYATSFESTNHLGDRLSLILRNLGFTERTEVYGRGDGAFWIVER